MEIGEELESYNQEDLRETFINCMNEETRAKILKILLESIDKDEIILKSLNQSWDNAYYALIEQEDMLGDLEKKYLIDYKDKLKQLMDLLYE